MSEITPFVETPYLEQARERITEQFKSKDIFDRYLQLLIKGQIDILSVYKDLVQLRSIDTAIGEQLNIIGRIVGQERVLLESDLFEFFGFVGTPKSGSFGDLFNSLVGAKFYNLGAPTGGNILLDDDTYRIFIKAKIFKNTTTSTPEEFIAVINLIFGTTLVSLSEEGNANVTVLIGKLLSDFEKTLINYISYDQGYPSRLIPKTVGVGVKFGEFNGGQFFGFDGVPGAQGFGDLNQIYGYGLKYGLAYGGSGNYNLIHNGDYLHDGTETYNSQIVDTQTIGGYFANLITI